MSKPLPLRSISHHTPDAVVQAIWQSIAVTGLNNLIIVNRRVPAGIGTHARYESRVEAAVGSVPGFGTVAVDMAATMTLMAVAVTSTFWTLLPHLHARKAVITILPILSFPLASQREGLWLLHLTMRPRLYVIKMLPRPIIFKVECKIPPRRVSR